MIVGFPHSVYTTHNAVEVVRDATGMSEDDAHAAVRALTPFGWTNSNHRLDLDVTLYISSDVQDIIDDYNAPFSVFMRDVNRRVEGHKTCDCSAMLLTQQDLECLLMQYKVTLTPR